MIPEKTRPEWKDLVTGEQTYPLTNYVLQLMINQAKNGITEGVISPDKAVEEIYELCKKYEKAVKKDMETIFGQIGQSN